MKINKLYIIALLGIMLPISSIGQSSVTGRNFKYRSNSNRPNNYINSIKATLMLGGASYYGELCENSIECFQQKNIAIGLGVQYRWTRHVSSRFEITYMQLSGDDAKGEHVTRNLSFKANNIDINIVGIYDPLPYIKMFRRRHAFVPYVFLGVGLVSYNPRAKLDGTWYNLREIKTEQTSYSKLALNIPFGGGIRYKAGPHLDISLEFGYHLTFTDYLDDVSNQYPKTYESTLQQNLSDRSLSPQSIRGSSATNDHYFIVGFRAAYTIKVPRQHYNLHSKNAKFRSHKSIRR